MTAERKMKWAIMAMVLLVLASGFMATAHAGTVTIQWIAPDTCSDGSDIATNCPTSGYEVYQGTSITGTTYTLKETTAATVLSVTYTNVLPGTRCYFLKTVSGTLKSAESVRACANVPFVPPKSPGGVTVVTVALPAP